MPRNNGTAALSSRTIGIIGAGHLGMTLAETLAGQGFYGQRILLSHAGDPATRRKIQKAGFIDNTTTNEDLLLRSSVIFVAIRPQALASLDGLLFPKDALVVSCIAGVPRAALGRRWGVEVIRMMPSGPDTIRGGKGVAAVFPANDLLTRILEATGLQVQVLTDEEEMHVFTAGVCLPAAVLTYRAAGRDPDDGIREAAIRHPLLSAMYAWTTDVLPSFTSGADQEAYTAAMCTQGGITEEMVLAIRAGEDLSAAAERGIERSREIGRTSLA